MNVGASVDRTLNLLTIVSLSYTTNITFDRNNVICRDIEISLVTMEYILYYHAYDSHGRKIYIFFDNESY